MEARHRQVQCSGCVAVVLGVARFTLLIAAKTSGLGKLRKRASPPHNTAAERGWVRRCPTG